MTDTIGIAMVGARAFGEFCLKAFAQVAGLKIVAVVDSDFARAQTLADKYEATAYSDLQPVLERPDIVIVTLSKPPFLHAEQGLAVLEAGKHLFCENHWR